MDEHQKWTPVVVALRETTGKQLKLTAVYPVGGGCINSAAILAFDRQRYFVKYNTPSRLNMFIAEARGLTELKTGNVIRVPTPTCHGAANNIAFLVLEFLELTTRTSISQEKLGQQLAALHRFPQPYFGWHQNNTIGTTLQVNDRSASWPAFFSQHRIGFQLHLALRNGYASLESDGIRLAENLECFFQDYTPKPSLLHGDLWSGNVGTTADGESVIFDPAVYFGDRETDIAMTELFGGFAPEFYAAYREAWPLDPGYEVRRTLYNLYHVLNHLNLFGGAYLMQAKDMVDRLLAEIQ